MVERALHGSFFQRYGITPQVFDGTPLSPACHHYVSYLIAAAYAEPYEVLLGALLPCFWIYAEVGRDIHARAAPANPYQAWIDTYAGEQFQAAVEAMIGATDEAAAGASPAVARAHACGLHAGDPAGMDFLGSRPTGWSGGRCSQAPPTRPTHVKSAQSGPIGSRARG